VIVVSHDRYFLDRTIDVVFALEPGGNIRQYPGNYSVYLDVQKAETEPTQAKATAKSANPSTAQTPASKVEVNATSSATTSDKPRKLSFKEKREYETLETQVPEMEAEKAALEKRLYNNPPNDFNQLQQLTEQLAQLSEAIDQATERWLELAERA
jgi:ABC transport system ATP-binding/permease protein